MRLGHLFAVVCSVVMGSPSLSAQPAMRGTASSRSGRPAVAMPPGITFHVPPAPPAAPPAMVTRPAGPSARGSHHDSGSHGHSDRFLADSKTYAPRFNRRHRFQPYSLPYIIPSFPYFLPVDDERLVSEEKPRYLPSDDRPRGYLRLDVEPATTQVYIDGYFIGSIEDVAPGYPLASGPHRIELRAEGFETAAFDVRIRPNDRVTFTKELRSLANAPQPPVAGVGQPVAAKTLYVIPRCYAGDRRPLAAQLPVGCRIEDVRIIPAGR
jgi:hypothetical protein